jgi:hypothetical protein
MNIHLKFSYPGKHNRKRAHLFLLQPPTWDAHILPTAKAYFLVDRSGRVGAGSGGGKTTGCCLLPSYCAIVFSANTWSIPEQDMSQRACVCLSQSTHLLTVLKGSASDGHLVTWSVRVLVPYFSVGDRKHTGKETFFSTPTHPWVRGWGSANQTGQRQVTEERSHLLTAVCHVQRALGGEKFQGCLEPGLAWSPHNDQYSLEVTGQGESVVSVQGRHLQEGGGQEATARQGLVVGLALWIPCYPMDPPVTIGPKGLQATSGKQLLPFLVELALTHLCPAFGQMGVRVLPTSASFQGPHATSSGHSEISEAHLATPTHLALPPSWASRIWVHRHRKGPVGWEEQPVCVWHTPPHLMPSSRPHLKVVTGEHSAKCRSL